MKLNNCKEHPNHDTYICQKCGKTWCSGCREPSWRPDLTGHESAGNICPTCLADIDVYTIGTKYVKSLHWAKLLELTWVAFCTSCGIDHVSSENKKIEFVRRVLYELVSYKV